MPFPLLFLWLTCFFHLFLVTNIRLNYYYSPPNYAIFKPFSCRVFPYLWDYAANKLAPCTRPWISLGYSNMHKGFRCYDPESSRVFTTSRAQIDESIFPFFDSSPSSELTTSDLTTFLDVGFLPHTSHHVCTLYGPSSWPMQQTSRPISLVDDGSAHLPPEHPAADPYT